MAKLYYKAHGSEYWRRLNRALADVAIHRPAPSGKTLHMLEAVEQRITTSIDVGHVIERKRTALHAHVSQIGSLLAGKLPTAQSPMRLVQRPISVPVTPREHPSLKTIFSAACRTVPARHSTCDLDRLVRGWQRLKTSQRGAGGT